MNQRAPVKQSPAPRPAPAAPPAGKPDLPAPRGRLQRFLILAAGVVVTHFILFAPSLLGRKILLPLDMLAMPNAYLPSGPEYAGVEPRNVTLTDEVFQFEFQRRFAASEFRAGRVPLWSPYHYCGAPFFFNSFSPFNVPYYLFPHPLTLAWTHVLVALVAAAGAYVFFREVLGVGFWPAVVTAWCLPLTAFFQLWLGFFLSFTAAVFPWVLVAVERVIRRPFGWGGPCLALVTGVLLVSGAFDIAGQSLLAAGLFALWRLGERYFRDRDARPAYTRAGVLAGAWAIGFLLAAPSLAPLAEYLPTGLRMQNRARNQSERPPIGLAALPQMVFPMFYGSLERGWSWLLPDAVSDPVAAGNLQESGAQAYAGLFAVLVVAPLGLASRRLRSLNLFWLLMGLLAAAWTLNVPVLTTVLQLPGLNLMSHNRFLFVTGFAVLVLTAAGLDAVAKGEVVWSRWFLVPVLLLVLLGAWCAERVVDVNELARVPPPGKEVRPPGPGLQAPGEGRDNLAWYWAVSVAGCGIGLALWLVVFRASPRVAVAVLGAAMVADLLWFSRDQNPQSDPALYYPNLPPLAELGKRTETAPGRVVGLGCLPPLLPQTYAFRDVRGYDAVDPARVVSLLLEVRDKRMPLFPYAMTQTFLPKFQTGPAGEPRLPPVLDMLNVRYLVGRGDPPPAFRPLVLSGDDYWVYENRQALPRAYVPASVTVRGAERIPGLVTAVDFDPRAVAYVSTGPPLTGPCKGSAEVIGETPVEVRLAVDMETPGMLVLADQWYAGWKADLDGRPLPVEPVNHAVRGVRLPAGKGTLVFRYEPAGWARGVALFAVAAALLAAWAAAVAWFGRRQAVPAV